MLHPRHHVRLEVTRHMGLMQESVECFLERRVTRDFVLFWAILGHKPVNSLSA